MTQTHKPWTITAKAGGELDILLYEMIGEDFFGEGTTAKSFAEDLKAAGSVSKIHLRVNSPGGSVFDGIAIYNTLLSHGAKVTAQVDGLAASIASVIIMAASEIAVAENGIVMIHNPRTVIGGDSSEMRKMAETMDKVKASMVTAYRRHSTLSADEIGALMDAETWMDADEAVENGFAESVMTPEGDEADVAAHFDLSRFRKVPAQIAAMFGAPAKPPRAEAEKDTKRVDGEDLTKDCFAYRPDDNHENWKLPIKFSSDAKTKSHIRNAISRWSSTDMPDKEEKAKARGRIKSAAKTHGIEIEEGSLASANANMCDCDCEACLENNCSACAMTDCEDENCTDCPMQEEADARVAAQATQEAELAAAKSQLKIANQQIAELEAQKQLDAKEMRARDDRAAKWMQRVSGELEESQKLFAASVAESARQSEATKAAHAALMERITVGEAVLVKLSADRAQEMAATAKWTERLSCEMEQLTDVCDWVMEEVKQLKARGEAATSVTKQIASASEVVASVGKACASDEKASIEAADRLCVRLEGVVAPAVIEQIRARACAREESWTAMRSAETILANLSTNQTEEAALTAKFYGEIVAKMQNALNGAEEIAKELRRRASAAESANDLGRSVESASHLFADLKLQVAEPISAAGALKDLTRASELCAAAAEEIGRRSRLAELAR